MHYQLIFHREVPYEVSEITEGHIYRERVDAHKCAYEYYKAHFTEGATLFADIEDYRELLSVSDFIAALTSSGQLLISATDGSHTYISYAESVIE